MASKVLPELLSTCCAASLDAAWMYDGAQSVLVGVCSKCERVDVRCNPMTLKTELVRDGDAFSNRPREVVTRKH